MPSRTSLLRIHDMLESIDGIEQALAGKIYQDFEQSWVLRSAVERGIEIISEASRYLSEELKTRHPGYPVAGYRRNWQILRHDYQRIQCNHVEDGTK